MSQRSAETRDGDNITRNAADRERTFEDWMKIAADNKINAANTWNLALIDYFHELAFLKEGDSINFQRASCTLDGCVKIYVSRVDSVDLEAKKLLSGLATRGGKDTNEDDGNGEETVKKRRAVSSGKTLEKDFTTLNLKKLDMDFLVDPLFRKTSADFDEGSASGLLLSHLMMAQDGKIIFDASDEATNEREKDIDLQANFDQMTKQINIDLLRVKFLQDASSFWDLEICPSLSSFTFNSSSSAASEFTLNTELLDEMKRSTEQMPDIEETEPVNEGDFGADHDTNFRAHSPVLNHPDGFDDSDGDGGPEIRPHEGRDPRNPGRSQHPLGELITVTDAEADQLDTDGTFSHFSLKFMRSWAGPEHWRPLHPKKKDVPVAPTSRKRKEKVKVDIFAEDVTEADIFATSSTSINLPKTGSKSQNNTLPFDEHFSPTDFFRLFLKPKRMPAFVSKDGRSISSLAGRQIDEEFWSQHQNDAVVYTPARRAEGISEVPDLEFDDFSENGDDVGDGFGSQDIKNEDPLLESLAGGTSCEDMLAYGDQLVAQPKKIKASFIHYAKAPKRVDVKKLKDNLWQNITIDLTQEDHNENKFTEAVQNLKDRYQEKDLKDISVAFCFICLLHLANEKNLTIAGDQSMGDLVIQQNE